MNDNDKTLQSYNEHFQDYVKANRQSVKGAVKEWIDGVLAQVPKGGRVLEIGSGYGLDASYIQSQGYEVVPTDAAEAFVKLMHEKGLDARRLNALTDDFDQGFDVVFAQAVFLHFKAEELKKVLCKCFDCLKPGGVLAFSVKEGEGEGWPKDYLGVPRYFRFWKESDLRTVIEDAGFSDTRMIRHKGTRDIMLYVTARKD